MRKTSIRGSGSYSTRVYTDTGGEFHCWTHMGQENASLLELLDLSWGYAVVEDRMQMGPVHHPPRRFAGELWKTILRFSERTPEEIRAVIAQIADEKARAMRDGRY